MLDAKDFKILEVLKEDSSLTTSQISKRTAIPITTVHNRITKLKKEDYIQFTIRKNYPKFGKPVKAVILATVDYSVKIDPEIIGRQVKEFEEVKEVNLVAGKIDLMIEARTESIDSLNEFVTKKLINIKGIDRSETMIVLKEI